MRPLAIGALAARQKHARELALCVSQPRRGSDFSIGGQGGLKVRLGNVKVAANSGQLAERARDRAE